MQLNSNEDALLCCVLGRSLVQTVQWKSKVEHSDHNAVLSVSMKGDKLSHLFLFAIAENTGCVYCKGVSRWQNWVDGVEPNFLTVYHFGF